MSHSRAPPISPGCDSNSRRSTEFELSQWILDRMAGRATILGLEHALFFERDVIGLFAYEACEAR
jgi:hypothetical protein